MQPPEIRPPRDEVSTYRVRVDLDHAEPPIWRRLELASDLTLEQLHEILQTSMGWTDSHLHHFQVGPERHARVEPFLTDFAEEEGDEGTHERDVRVDQVLGEVGDRLFYEYDFGDGWGHTIELEAVTPYDESAPRATCTEGRRACPPEDCGGVGGYEQLLDAIAHPEAASEWQRELLDWMPEGFDPERFSVTETEAQLRLALSQSLTTLLPPPAERDAAVNDLVTRLGRVSVLPGELLSAADLFSAELPDAATREAMVRPWLHLLEVVGEGGVKLTQAGYLPPAVVSELAAELDQVEPWMGKANREEHTIPVAELRQSATAMGLVRKHKGRLLRTRAGTRLAADPQGLWAHVVASVPFGADHEKHAGVLALIAAAAGRPVGAGARQHGPALLSAAGWQLSGGIGDWDAYHWARPTIAVLDLLGAFPDRFTNDSATMAGRQFARAALRAPRG